MFAPSEMLLGGQNGSQMQFRIIFPHPFTARIRAARCWGPGFRNFDPKRTTKRGKKLVATLGPKWGQLLIQNGGHFWSKMGATFGPNRAPFLVQIELFWCHLVSLPDSLRGGHKIATCSSGRPNACGMWMRNWG